MHSKGMREAQLTKMFIYIMMTCYCNSKECHSNVCESSNSLSKLTLINE